MDRISVRKVAANLAIVGLACSGNAFATPGSGVTPSYKVVSGDADIRVRSIAGKLLLLEFGSDQDRGADQDHGNDQGRVNILNVHQTFVPGGYSGWHTHAGPGIVIVEQGTITIEQTAGCYVDYPQGSVLFEGGPNHIHNASNRTVTPVILDAYFFLPAFTPPGGNSRIDEPVQYGDCR
jgi:quercetin dioxygenase-like cupin family protein